MCGVHGFCDAFACILKVIQVSTCAGKKSWQPSERPTGLKHEGFKERRTGCVEDFPEGCQQGRVGTSIWSKVQ